jgi:hypothetical protein
MRGKTALHIVQLSSVGTYCQTRSFTKRYTVLNLYCDANYNSVFPTVRIVKLIKNPLPYAGYFCDETRRSTVPEVLSQNDASWNGVPEPFSLGIDMPNASPSPTEFWVTAFRNLFSLEK